MLAVLALLHEICAVHYTFLSLILARNLKASLKRMSSPNMEAVGQLDGRKVIAS